MERRQIFFKNSAFDFVDWSRFRRSLEISDLRKKSRMIITDSNRNIPQVAPVAAAKLGESIAKWKAEKQKAAVERKKCEKPVFKTGIVKRKVTGSPLLIMTNAYARKNFLIPNQIERVNRAKKSCLDDELNTEKTKLIQSGKQLKTLLPQLIKNEQKQSKIKDRNLVKTKSAPTIKTNPQLFENMKIKKKS